MNLIKAGNFIVDQFEEVYSLVCVCVFVIKLTFTLSTNESSTIGIVKSCALYLDSSCIEYVLKVRWTELICALKGPIESEWEGEKWNGNEEKKQEHNSKTFIKCKCTSDNFFCSFSFFFLSYFVVDIVAFGSFVNDPVHSILYIFVHILKCIPIRLRAKSCHRANRRLSDKKILLLSLCAHETAKNVSKSTYIVTLTHTHTYTHQIKLVVMVQLMSLLNSFTYTYFWFSFIFQILDRIKYISSASFIFRLFMCSYVSPLFQTLWICLLF